MSSHKTFRIKRLLNKKQNQNHPMPQLIQIKISNEVTYNDIRQ
ncbi:hypothetical protein PANDA_010139, partial [Ailuropoda melanoleuca]